MDFNGTPTSSAGSNPDQQVNHVWQAIQQLTANTAALQGTTNHLTESLDRLTVAETDRMSADPIPDDPLPAYAKGSGPRIPEPVTYDGEFNDHVRDDFITRLTEWIDFYDRRRRWADKSEKVTVAAGYFRERLRTMFDIERTSDVQPDTFQNLLEWVRTNSQDVNANHRRRDEWQKITQQAVSDQRVMTYATELLQLAKRISPAKSDPEIKEHFRVGLIADIRIKMEENPANDNLPLYEYINKAVRFEQILDHIANISGLPRGLYARKGQINAIARAPRRGNLQSTYRQTSQKDAKPRKGTPA